MEWVAALPWNQWQAWSGIRNRGEDESGWILEVIDKENASTVWDEPFDTDREALEEVMEVIERDGIRSFLEGESEGMR